jgi:hypothetical protein
MNTRIVASAAFLLLSFPVNSGEAIKEMTMLTDVGEVVLTLEPCSFTPNHGFPYAAYATEKGSHDHLGCWHEPEPLDGKPMNQVVNIWFPEISAIATYNKKLFKPRTQL